MDFHGDICACQTCRTEDLIALHIQRERRHTLAEIRTYATLTGVCSFIAGMIAQAII